MKEIERQKRHKKYRRTKVGLISMIYYRQRVGSRKRNHPMPDYSKPELVEWALSQANFDNLYNKWVDSDYKKRIVPSIDRLDDYLPYTLSNIRLTTWAINESKGHRDRKNGRNNKASISVKQFTLDGVFVKEHFSLMQAERNTGISNSNISLCSRGIRKSAGGYIWAVLEKR